MATFKPEIGTRARPKSRTIYMPLVNLVPDYYDEPSSAENPTAFSDPCAAIDDLERTLEHIFDPAMDALCVSGIRYVTVGGAMAALRAEWGCL